MVEWFVLLTPLALLPVIWLLGFVGCGLEQEGQAAPSAVETKTKAVSLSWSSPLGNTTSVKFSCVVQPLNKTGLPTGEPVPGVAPTQAAWPGSFLPSSGKMSAPITVEMPPAPQYQIEGTAEVFWGSAPSAHTQKQLTKDYFGNLESQSWEFVLAYGPQGWYLS